jgi:hypothetical protein
MKDVNGLKQESEFDFVIYKEPTWLFQFDYGTYTARYSADVFNSKYNFDSVNNFLVSARYYPLLNFGFHYKFITDYTDLQIDAVTGLESSSVNHLEQQAHLLGRLASDSLDYYASKITLMAGLQQKKYQTEFNEVLLFIPEDFFGLQGGAEIEKRELIWKFLSAKSRALIGVDISNPESYTLELKQELLLELNSLGPIFVVSPYYTYDFRYPGFSNTELVFSYLFKTDKRDILNNNRGTIRETITAFNIGLRVKF